MENKIEFKYKELVKIGFERFENNCQVHIDLLGFQDFYLFLKTGNDITFEWNHNEPDIVKMVRYKKANVLNYAIIKDKQSLLNMIELFKENKGNKGDKIIVATKPQPSLTKYTLIA